jgi:hypothetical protein
MNLRALADLFMAWIDVVARALLAVVGRFDAPRRVRLIEGDGGLFDVEIAGGRGSGAGRHKPGSNRAWSARAVAGSAAGWT